MHMLSVAQACAASLQHDALVRFGLLAGLTAEHGPAFRTGLCAVQKQDNGRDVQLKVKTDRLV